MSRDKQHTGQVLSLTNICQNSILLSVEDSGYNARLINDIAKRLTLLDRLLEPLLAALVGRNAVTDVAFLAFLHPGRLTLEIAGLSGIRNSTLKLIGYNCMNLVTLDARNCNQMSNSIVRCVLQGCEMLQELHLDGCPRISDAAFDPLQCPFDRLKAAQSLKIISLKGCRQITGSFAAVLQKCYRSLQTLNLSQCKHIVSSCVSGLMTHCTLQNLDLSFVGCIGDDAFTPLPGLGLGIRELNLCQSRISDLSLLSLSTAVRNITILRLQWCGGISDTGIEAIVSNCHSIKIIDLKSCNITDLSLIAIGRCCEVLEELDMSWCVGITDCGIKALCDACFSNKLKYLMTLKATWCSQLSDAAVVDLVNLTGLRVFESFGLSMSAECKRKMEESRIEVRTEIESTIGDTVLS